MRTERTTYLYGYVSKCTVKRWIAAKKAKAGLRHAVVCPNVTGRAKEWIAQSMRACAGSLVTSYKWREVVSSGRLVCRCHDAFLWCYVCFVLLRFQLFYAFVEAAVLRLAVLEYIYACAPIATRFLFVFFVLYIWR